MEKAERRKHKIITENRQATLNKRETSWQGLQEKMECGEDGVLALANQHRQLILSPKKEITKKDLDEIADLRQLHTEIQRVETQFKAASGYQKYQLKQQLIEMRKSQYIIKNAFRCPIFSVPTHSYFCLTFDDDTHLTPDLSVEGVFLHKDIIQFLLSNYDKLKQEAKNRVNDDIWYVMYDLDLLLKQLFKKYPEYEKIFELKMAGCQCKEIADEVNAAFGFKYSPEYVSSVWRNKMPQALISIEEDRYLDWYYLTQEKGYFKKCNKCGRIKLAHKKYFSSNKNSGDGFYSICKECRKKKGGK